MATNAIHVTLAGDRAGDYLIEQELPDGRLLLRLDPAYPAVMPVSTVALRRSRSSGRSSGLSQREAPRV
jgi:hypothetical protein